MREEDLVSLGFEVVEVSAEESGDEAFYYFKYDFGVERGICLITPANTSIIDNKWYVEIFDYDNIRFTNYQDVRDLINIIEKGINILKK